MNFDITEGRLTFNNPLKLCCRIGFWLSLFLVNSCNFDTKSKDDLPPPMSIQPVEIALNTDSGYPSNVISGLPISYIIDKKADTVITGKPFTVFGSVLNPDSLEPPFDHKSNTIKNGEPTILPEFAIIKSAAPVLEVIEVDEKSLKHVPIASSDSDAYLVNTIGDTIKTRTPLSLTPQRIPCKYPKILRSKAPVLNEDAMFEFHRFSVEQGLNSNSIDDIRFDKQGNLWFGSWRYGLSKFDGTNFWHFTDASGFPGMSYTKPILHDSKGNIWLGSVTGGLAKFNGFSFEVYTEKQGLSASNIRSLFEDSKGNIWIGTWGGGIIKFDGKFFTHYSVADGISDDVVRNIVEDDQGNIWFSCYAKGLVKYTGKEFIHYTENDGLPKTKVNQLCKRKAGGIWVATYAGLISIDGEKITRYNYEENEKCRGLVSVFEAKNGTLWMGPYCGGLVKYQNNRFSYYEEKHGIGEDKIESINEDASGQIWLGSQGSGLIRFNPKGYAYLTKEQGLVKSNIRHVTKLSNGNIALASWNSGFSIFDGKSFQNYLLPGSTAENVISQIFEDSRHRIWFLTQSPGAFCLKDNNLYRYTIDQGLSSNNIHKIFETQNGDILFCTHQGGLSIFNDSTFTRFSVEEGLPNSVIFDAVQDSSGIIWIATNEGGLTRFDGKTFTVFSEKEGLPSNSINQMVVSPNGNLWMALTSNGIGLIKNNKLIVFNQSTGLPGNEINSISILNDSSIWIGHNFGLSSIFIRQRGDSSVYQLRHYQSQDGIRWLGFNSSFVDPKQAWWATEKGVMKGDVNHLIKVTKKPIISFAQLIINDVQINFNDSIQTTKAQAKFDRILPFVNIPVHLKLPHQSNNLNFSFSSIAWDAPHKIWYSYKLDGIDKNWSAPSQENTVEYKNLPQGNYVLKASVADENLIWTPPIKYAFEILPPLWRTWWAYGIYSLAFLLALRWFVKRREQALVERKVELELMVDDRTVQLSQEKKQVELKNREILDSIEYAKRIQATILPPARIVKEYLQDSFILYLPKDIVAGDFYWIETLKESNVIFFAACDSTGHGVPGAMVSVVCHNALNKALTEFGNRTPASILDKTADLVIENFTKNSEGTEEIQDGMDASICALNFKTRELVWAGANCPLILIRKGGILEEIKPDKQPVGRTDRRHPFTDHAFQLFEGDIIYLITDGFADQFGGVNNKKFQRKRLRELLVKIHDLTMLQQRVTLFETFDQWKGDFEQVDDITIIGVKV
jgi:ligand-binding sensor domain-containing protein/serine phosphatase RsbU (regulator of sigma subunit)